MPFRIRRTKTFTTGMDIRLLLPFATEHFGLVTLAHSRKAGISRAAWYRAIRAGSSSHSTRAWRGWSVPPTAVSSASSLQSLRPAPTRSVSHRSAAYLWGIPRPENDPVDILFPPRRRKVALKGVYAHRPRDGADLRRALRSRIPTTNILRTLCDLGACDPAAVPGAIGHTLATGLATVTALDRAIARHSERGRHGIVAFRNGLHEWQLDGKPPDSVLEPAMRRLFHDFNLPPAEFHAVVEGYEVDFRIINVPVIVECDGWTTHGLDKHRFERDPDRDAELLAAGYVTVRRTYRQIVQRRAETARKIEATVVRWAPELLHRTA